MAENYIYFDNAATTRVDPRVLQAMRPYLDEAYANPSSLHGAGREARHAVDEARRLVACLLHVSEKEIVFTASGTESDNLALRGVVEALGWRDCHMITSAIEHPAILETCRYLNARGIDISYLPVDGEGLVDPNALVKAFRPSTRVVSIMTANNVVGTVQPVGDLARIAHERGALFHTDAVQAVGKIPIDLSTGAIDLLSLSAHKIHGPKGVGALYVNSRAVEERLGSSLAPIIYGGGQERGLRSATENVAGIVGLGKAAEIAASEMSAEAARLVALRDRLISGILAEFPNAYLIGSNYRRLPGHLCIGFAAQEGEAIKLLLLLDETGIAVSTGSACSASHAGEPSHVLLAMGFDPVRARGSLRITLGRFNTEEETDRFFSVLVEAMHALRPPADRRPAVTRLPSVVSPN